MLLADKAGGVRDPCVHYDGRTILFSYRPGGTGAYHLYTINADPRFDMPKFCPNPEYIREMKRYGILPKDVDPARQRIDPYEVDKTSFSVQG